MNTTESSSGLRPQPRPANRDAGGPSKTAATADSQNAQGQEQEPLEEAGGGGLSALFLAVPSWLASLIFHVFLLLVLALITFANPDLQQEIFHTSSLDKEEIEELQDFEFENQEIEVLDPSEFNTPDLDMGMADIGDITAPETSVDSNVSAHESTEVELGMPFGTEGHGLGESGPGSGATTFFGVRTEGSHFMYVVDNSNSMSSGKFENAVSELVKSINQLSETSFFYIVFYSDAAYPLFYPNTVPRWVRATPENKHKVGYWLETVHRCLKTRGEEAMEHAMNLRPDVLYLLGDGAFTDNAAEATLAMQGEVDVTINTLGFNMRAEHAKDFDRIAKAFGGKFRSVQVDPQMKKISAQKNRPRNRTRNGDWGINLGN